MSENDLPGGNGYIRDKRWIEATLGDHTERLERIEGIVNSMANTRENQRGKISALTAVLLSLAGALITAGVVRSLPPKESPQVEALTKAINRLSDRQTQIEKAVDAGDHR